ncbi:MAG: hypothetical protein WAM79_03050 [Candidatus Sulfotelmatobacter sp.]
MRTDEHADGVEELFGYALVAAQWIKIVIDGFRDRSRASLDWTAEGGCPHKIQSKLKLFHLLY